MTGTGYKNIIGKIVGKTVKSPESYNAKELAAWLEGYLRCQREAIRILEEFCKGHGE